MVRLNSVLYNTYTIFNFLINFRRIQHTHIHKFLFLNVLYIFLYVWTYIIHIVFIITSSKFYSCINCQASFRANYLLLIKWFVSIRTYPWKSGMTWVWSFNSKYGVLINLLQFLVIYICSKIILVYRKFPFITIQEFHFSTKMPEILFIDTF